MKIQKFDVVLDEDGKNILTENFSTEYTGVKDASRPEWIAAVMNEVFGLSEKAEEYMYLICMTSSCGPIGFFELTHGTHNAALVGVREIFIRALLCGAAGIVLAHNHPGGLPNPSREDVSVTDKVRAASEFIGIQLYDHIIVGRDSWFSFAKEGKLAVALPEISDYNDNRQMRDFACKDAKDIHYQELAEGARYFKEEKGGREMMCQDVSIQK